MKLLIINADDCGLSRSTNDAVERCYGEGRITGTSIMPVGEYFGEAARMLKRIGKSEVGVHLTLTGGFKPCASGKADIRTLLGPAGVFLSDHRGFGARYFLRGIDPRQVYAEFREQIVRAAGEGLSVTHLDSHEHVHIFPGIFAVTADLAAEFDIPYIRMPFERFRVVLKDFSIKDFFRYAALQGVAGTVRKKVVRADLAYNRAFWGHFHSGRIDGALLRFILKETVDGINELAVHPGVIYPGLLERHPWYKNAERELEALMAGRWMDDAAKMGIRLISHREAAGL